MNTDKTLRFLVDDQKIKDLSKTANELAREMVVSARQYSTSSKQVVQDIEEQIRLIEKRNKTDKEIEQTKIQSRFAAGQITPEQRREEVGRLSMSSKTDDIQIRLLRDIIDTLKNTAKEELRENKVNVEKRIRDSKTVDVLSPKGDPMEIFKETIQRGEIGEKGKDEADERRDFLDFGRGGKRADRAAMAVAGAKSEFNLLAAGVGAILGAGAGMAANRLLQSADKFQRSAAVLGRHTGGGIDFATGRINEIDGTSAFLTPSEVAERFTSYRTSQGGREFSNQQMRRSFIAERQLGVGSSDISAVAGTTRYGRQDATMIMAQLESHLRRTSQDISVLPELMKQYTDTANSILQVSVSGDVGAGVSGMISLANVTGATGMELDQWKRGFQGLGQTQNPMARAMLMRSFSDINQDKSMFEIQAMMENPMAHMDEIGGAFSELQGQMGGDMARQAMYSLFEGRVSRSAILGAEGEDGQIDFSKLTSKGSSTKGSSILGDLDVANFVPAVEKSSARIESVIEKSGNDVLSKLDGFLEKMLSLFGVVMPMTPEEQARLKEGYKDKYGDDPSKVLMEDQLSKMTAIADKTPTREEYRLDMRSAITDGILDATERNRAKNIEDLF